MKRLGYERTCPPQIGGGKPKNGLFSVSSNEGRFFVTSDRHIGGTDGRVVKTWASGHYSPFERARVQIPFRSFLNARLSFALLREISVNPLDSVSAVLSRGEERMPLLRLPFLST